MNDPEYHLGTTADELERLGYQHQAWADVAIDLYRKAGLGLDKTVLDLGCGPGFATLDLARLVGTSGTVHAVDESDRFLQTLRNRLETEAIDHVEVHQADVHDLPLQDSSVDAVFARWLFCFVRDPTKVLQEAARVLRPGGTFLCLDYFEYLAVKILPAKPSIERVFEAYDLAAKELGAGYDIGNELPHLIHDAGLQVRVIDPVVRIARPGSIHWRWMEFFHRNYMPRLVEMGRVTTEEQAQFWVDWNTNCDDPASFGLTPPMLAITAEKPA